MYPSDLWHRENLEELAASALAMLCNGGRWSTHYTETQKERWRTRVRAMRRGDHDRLDCR